MSKRLQELARGIMRACERSRVMEASEKSRLRSISLPWWRAREAEAKVTKMAVAMRVREAGSRR